MAAGRVAAQSRHGPGPCRRRGWGCGGVCWRQSRAVGLWLGEPLRSSHACCFTNGDDRVDFLFRGQEARVRAPLPASGVFGDAAGLGLVVLRRDGV